MITFVPEFHLNSMVIKNFSNLIRRQAEKYGNREVFRHKDYKTNQWVSTSWNKFSQQVDTIAKALAELEVKEQENLATYTQNKPEGLIIDFAAYANRAVIVPLYATSSLSQIEYIINEAEIRFLFVGEQFQYDNAYEAQKVCPTLEKLIVLDWQKMTKHLFIFLTYLSWVKSQIKRHW